MKQVVKNFFVRGERYAKAKGWIEDQFGWRDIMNNTEWLDTVTVKEFFSLVGSHVRLGQLLARDRYSPRLASHHLEQLFC